MAGISLNRLHQHQLVINRFATGQQLRKLLKLARARGINSEWRRQWAAQSLLYSPRLRQQGPRYRRIDHPAANHWISHYRSLDRAGAAQRPGSQRLRRHLVIGFTGNLGLLMAPIPYVLSALDASGYDLLLVRRHSLAGYFSQNGQVLLEIEQHLRRLLQGLQAKGLETEQICSLGTSSGGLPALVVARNLGLPLGIAIGAGASPPLLEPGGLLDRLQPVRTTGTPQDHTTDLILAFAAENGQDSTCAELLQHYYRARQWLQVTPSPRAYPGCAAHALFIDLVAQGCTLDQALSDLLAHPPRDPGA
ncbi:hypothetical protein [Cyanobium sp. PCC 7001]|uniref:hypothetical protein n=1 Tax=Cyanobium sp. PCC 7001 TaxID=180281 RepID=UPI0005BC400F|nr:hypothetical protein [Cyanobium sp. PCC 7001]